MLSYFHNLKKRKKNDIRKKTNKIYKIWSVFNLKKKKKKRRGREGIQEGIWPFAQSNHLLEEEGTESLALTDDPQLCCHLAASRITSGRGPQFPGSDA